MAFAVPKIQFKNLDTTGDTQTGSGVIQSVPSTAGLEVGMFVRGAGIPTGATVGSFTASTVTLAGGVQASATAAGVAIAFGYEIEFQYPPKEPKGETIKTNAVTSRSLSGVRQVSVNYVEGIRALTFSFLSHTLFQTLDNFLRTHACLGKSFRYFDDKTLTTYVSVELDELVVDAKKLVGKGVDQYIWEVPLTIRRVL